MKRAHKIRLAPTQDQEAYFRRACGTARFTYNWALAEWKRRYQNGDKPNGRALKKDFNALRKAGLRWTYEVHRDCTSQPFANLQQAFGRFFKKQNRYPQFKKKGQHDAFYVANDKVRLEGKRIRLPVIGWIKMREALRFEGKVLGVTVSRDGNRWHAAVQVDVQEIQRQRTSDGIIGIDLGIQTTLTTSDGECIQGPKALRNHLKRLQRASRVVSRRKQGSQNRKRAVRRLARIHQRIREVRQDFLHKTTTKLVSENQAIGIEGLRVRNMLQNHRLARAIADEGWGELCRQLEYKALVYGTQICVWDAFYPSSKLCSKCGTKREMLPLSVRSWTCAQCGAQHDRDVNAAQNLLPRATGEGTPVEWRALAGDVSPVKLSMGKQELRVRTCAH
jgi:putative transposase